MCQLRVHQGLPPKSAIKYGVNCFFNDKPMRRFIVEGSGSDPSTPTTSPTTFSAKITTLDPAEIASRYPAKQKHEGPGLCLRRLRISQDPPMWIVPNVVDTREAGRLMDLMDRQQGRVPPNGWRVPEGEDIQELMADLEGRLAAAAGDPGQPPLGDLELRRLPAEALSGASVVSRPKEVKPCRAVYLFLHDIPSDGAGELLFVKSKLQVRAREGFAVVWDMDSSEHQGLPPRNRARYGISCTFCL
ncbi:Prolyl 4-hydroxylase 5 [Durusdinium trenchii]|uniref:Prolyl 4-hydroxylase 5 n=2 Tax=Durusdinium trenchii TaxID=1381693 RepID=A0ABP0MLB9_9DINO